MRTEMIALAAAALTSFACGGSQTQTERVPDESPESGTDAKIRRAQIASCRPVCERLVDCSVEDLHENKSEAEIAELDVPQLIPRAIEECDTDCRAKTLSPRQINIMQECVNGPQECGAYEKCLERAKRGG